MGGLVTSNQGSSYGAALTTKQFIVLVTAIALGTLLEWYDFFVYAQLNSYLTKAFFPSQDPSVQQLSFWGVYAVGFISRPVGSVIFGHIGDTKGRRLNLLLTICIMAVPTVLIGCLPTFDHVGIAAPALLALLRLIQGLAMGGEFGSAMVYLHEIAPASKKGLVGSMGFCSCMFGCMMGVLMVVIVEAACTPDQMLVFGWRIPFLLSIVSASAALALRLHMPEPHEFVEDRHAVIQHNLERIASHRSSASTAGAVLSPRNSQINSRTASSLANYMVPSLHSTNKPHDIPHGLSLSKDSTQDTMVPVSTTQPLIADVEQGIAGGKVATNDMRTSSIVLKDTNDTAGMDTADAASHPAHSKISFSQDNHHDCARAGSVVTAADIPASEGEYVPIMRLLRKHTPAVILQFLFEAWVSVGFWVITTWLPLQMTKAPINMPQVITQAMLIVNLTIMGGVQLASGWLSDIGVPRVWFCMSCFLVAAAISCPVLLGMSRAGVAGAWLLHTLLMVIMACVLGVVPATLSSIYPASVRATGFNLGHNMSMSWLGGISPTIVTALVAATGRTFLAPGILITIAAVVSMAAAAVLLKYAPQANGTARPSKA